MLHARKEIEAGKYGYAERASPSQQEMILKKKVNKQK